MNIIEAISTVAGSSLATLFVAKWLGKKKEEVEIALKWQEYSNNHIEGLEKKVEELSKKVEELIKVSDKKDRIIEDQKKTIIRWEQNSIKLEGIIERKDTQIAELFEEIEKK